jgi:hypothetical protein
MTTYIIQEDGLPIVEAHIVTQIKTCGEFAVLSLRYARDGDLKKIELFMSEAQLMQFSNVVTRAVANVRPPLADMDEEEECAEEIGYAPDRFDDGEQDWDESDGPQDIDYDVVTLAEQADAAKKLKEGR